MWLSYLQVCITFIGMDCLEWWQLPDRFRRGLVDVVECDEINSGGGGKVWDQDLSCKDGQFYYITEKIIIQSPDSHL